MAEGGGVQANVAPGVLGGEVDARQAVARQAVAERQYVAPKLNPPEEFNFNDPGS